MEERSIRTGNIRIKVSPEMLDRIEFQARALCMPVATVCAFAVGDWVQRQENNLKLTRMAVMEASRRSLDDLGLTDDKLQALFGPMLTEIAKQQANLSLDLEEPKGS